VEASKDWTVEAGVSALTNQPFFSPVESGSDLSLAAAAQISTCR
jgi:hypothetical protein